MTWGVVWRENGYSSFSVVTFKNKVFRCKIPNKLRILSFKRKGRIKVGTLLHFNERFDTSDATITDIIFDQNAFLKTLDLKTLKEFLQVKSEYIISEEAK